MRVRIPNCPRFGCYELFKFSNILRMLPIPCHSIWNHALLQCPISEANVAYNIHKQFDSHAPLCSQGRSSQNG